VPYARFDSYVKLHVKLQIFPFMFVAGTAQSVQLIRYRLYEQAVFVRVPAEARSFQKRPSMYPDQPTRYQMGARALLPG